MNAQTQLRRAPATSAPRLRPAALPSRVLVLAATSKMPYRVAQCLAAEGVQVFAIGGRRARGLRFSKRIEGFVPTRAEVDGSASYALILEVNAAIASYGIELVVAGDALATRSLIAMRDRLAAPCFPMPDLPVFDLLNDKARFHELCLNLGVDVPKTRLFETRDAFRDALARGEFDTAQIAKPLSMTGSEGCLRVDLDSPETALARINYAPVLVQDFIEGEDIGTSALCRAGEIRAFVAHRYRRNTYQTFYDERIYAVVERIARATNYDGVFNFDMRLTPDGRILYLECNPRIFLKIAMSMFAGVNFIALGAGRRAPVEPYLCPSTQVRLPKAFALSALTRGRVDARSWRATRYLLGDPMFYAREELGWEEDRQLG